MEAEKIVANQFDERVATLMSGCGLVCREDSVSGKTAH
jgi:hypothetical protein